MVPTKDYHGNGMIQFFEGTRFVGEQKRYFCGANDGGESFSAYWPHTAYFCSQCGEIWGRAICQYGFDYKPRVLAPWTIEQRRCVKHGDGYFLGHIPVLRPEQDLDACSPELLLREATLLLMRQP